MKKVLLVLFTALFLQMAHCQSHKKTHSKAGAKSSSDQSAAGMVQIGPPPLPEDTTPPPANGKYAEMTFEKQAHDFGLINQGAKVYYKFKFTNTGGSDLIISNAVGSCGCTIPEYPKAPVKPGQSGVIKVLFNSAGKAGQQHKTITIACNTKSKKEILNITANVKEKAK